MSELDGGVPCPQMRRAVTRQSDSPISQINLPCTADSTERSPNFKRDLCAAVSRSDIILQPRSPNSAWGALPR